MKRLIIFCMALLLVMVNLVACGPNYADELEEIQEDLESLTGEWVEFGGEIGERSVDITSTKDLNDMFDKLADESERFIEKSSKLLEKLESIKDGISKQEYDSYNSIISVLKQAMKEMQTQMIESKIVE